MKQLRQRIFLAVFCIFLLLPASILAQADEEVPANPDYEDFFIAPLVETLFFGRDNLAFGGGISVGYGTGTAFGIKLLFAVDTESFVFMEILFLFRYYLQGKDSSEGPFIQLNAGPLVFEDSQPGFSGYGSISAGLSAGWRFPFKERWFYEPYVRIGYPYIAGAGISAGIRF